MLHTSSRSIEQRSPLTSEPSREGSSRRATLCGVFGALISIVSLGFLFGWRLSLMEAFAILGLAGLLGALSNHLRTNPFIAIGSAIAVSLLLRVFDVATLTGYGDTGHLEGLLQRGEFFSRWPGSTILQHTFHLFGSTAAEQFVAIGGFLTFWSCVVFASWRWRTSPAHPLLFVTPILYLSGSGYSEYYPFINGPILILIIALCEEPLNQLPPVRFGGLLACFSFLYVGFLPIAGIVGCAYLLTTTRARFNFLIAFFATASMLIFALVPSPSDLPTMMYAGVNTTSEWSVQRYRSGIIEGLGILRPSFALRPSILLDRLFMLMHAAGPASFVLCGAWCAYCIRGRLSLPIAFSHNVRLITALVLFEVIFFLFMPPHLGRRRDIDLFGQTYIILVVALSYIVAPQVQRWYPFLIGVNLPAIWLLLSGIPQKP